MNKAFDVAVIGAGSTGATTAYYLAKEGFRVLVIDKRGVAQGMTAYSLGSLGVITPMRMWLECRITVIAFS
nr:FAD-binding oxidoreductase [Vulcanisaeta sp. JCM 16159]